MTTALYVAVREALREGGFAGDYDWAQNVRAPASADAFAREYVWVVLNSGMKNTVARGIMDRLWPALQRDGCARDVFRHPGKGYAIDHVYYHRSDYFDRFRQATDVLAFCESLPWIGPITKYHLAKNLGVDVAKPDRWLVRVAATTGETVDGLCRRLAGVTGDRVATVDLMIWRACAIGLLVIDGSSLSIGRAA